MLVKFTTPTTPEQLATWSRNAPAVRVLSIIVVLVSLAEIGFSGSNLAALIQAKATFLGSYAPTLAGVIGYGLTAAMAWALYAVCLVFFQTIFRNTDDDETNDANSHPMLIGLYALVIFGLSAALIFTGTKGAQELATDRLAYKAQTKSSTSVDSVFAANTQQIRADFDKEVARLEAAFGQRERTIAAQYKSQRSEYNATVKPWSALKLKLATLESDYRDQLAQLATDKAAAIKQQMDLKNIAMSEAMGNVSVERKGIQSHNASEANKAATSQHNYVTALTYFSLCNVPLLILMYAIIGFVMCKSGMYLQMDVPDDINEGTAGGKFMAAIGHYFGAHTHNVAATIYNAAPVKMPMGQAPPLPSPTSSDEPKEKAHAFFFRQGTAENPPPQPPANNAVTGPLEMYLLEFRNQQAKVNSYKGRKTENAAIKISEAELEKQRIQNELGQRGYAIRKDDLGAFRIVKL